jgi:hypothetical protein
VTERTASNSSSRFHDKGCVIKRAKSICSPLTRSDARPRPRHKRAAEPDQLAASNSATYDTIYASRTRTRDDRAHTYFFLTGKSQTTCAATQHGSECRAAGTDRTNVLGRPAATWPPARQAPGQRTRALTSGDGRNGPTSTTLRHEGRRSRGLSSSIPPGSGQVIVLPQRHARARRAGKPCGLPRRPCPALSGSPAWRRTTTRSVSSSKLEPCRAAAQQLRIPRQLSASRQLVSSLCLERTSIRLSLAPRPADPTCRRLDRGDHRPRASRRSLSANSPSLELVDGAVTTFVWYQRARCIARRGRQHEPDSSQSRESRGARRSGSAGVRRQAAGRLKKWKENPKSASRLAARGSSLAEGSCAACAACATSRSASRSGLLLWWSGGRSRRGRRRRAVSGGAGWQGRRRGGARRGSAEAGRRAGGRAVGA